MNSKPTNDPPEGNQHDLFLKVLGEYLHGRQSIVRVLLERLDAFDASGDLRNSLYQFLREHWHVGRTIDEISRILAVEPKLYGYEVADTMSVSAAAVSGWKLEASITLENLEVLRRHYRHRIAALPRIEFLVDLAGYVHLIPELVREPDEEFAPALTMMQFWRLWHMLRLPLWFEAFVLEKKQLRPNAVAEINTLAKRTQLWYEEVQRRSGRKVKKSECAEATEPELAQLFEKWGAAAALALDCLDHICWTSPNE